MSNMSYCRFNNTSKDLGDCLDAIENQDYRVLADFERDGLEALLEYCEGILEYKEEIEEALKEKVVNSSID